MKELKVRTWDKNMQEFVYSTLGQKRYDIYMPSHTVDWQQYTGFQDVRGTDIYDGDILGREFNGKLFIHGTVAWSTGGYWCFKENNTLLSMNGIYVDVILGNAYEGTKKPYKKLDYAVLVKEFGYKATIEAML